MAYRPGDLSEALTGHCRWAHPGRSAWLGGWRVEGRGITRVLGCLSGASLHWLMALRAVRAVAGSFAGPEVTLGSVRPGPAQDASTPRGPAGPATRRYLLAGLLACGRCGRRLESAWSNGKPAYRCRHGYTSATGSSPDRPANLYIREDQILPRLAALAILQSEGSHPPRDRKPASAQVTASAQAAELIDRLRAADVTLIYDPATRAARGNGTAGNPGTRALAGPMSDWCRTRPFVTYLLVPRSGREDACTCRVRVVLRGRTRTSRMGESADTARRTRGQEKRQAQTCSRPGRGPSGYHRGPAPSMGRQGTK